MEMLLCGDHVAYHENMCRRLLRSEVDNNDGWFSMKNSERNKLETRIPQQIISLAWSSSRLGMNLTMYIL